jgi:hypothetical protein
MLCQSCARPSSRQWSERVASRWAACAEFRGLRLFPARSGSSRQPLTELKIPGSKDRKGSTPFSGTNLRGARSHHFVQTL